MSQEPTSSTIAMHYGVTPAEINDQSTMASRPLCSLDGVSPATKEQQRLTLLEQLGLTSSEPIPIFEEAVQSVARLLAAPICLVSVFEKKSQIFKATMGLSSLGLMNQLAATRELPKTESFGIQVVDSGQALMLSDVNQHPAFCKSLLVQKYGVQAYLGVPLMTSEQCCIGTVEVMDIMPRQYTQQDLALLELNARWAMSEYEKQCWLKDGKVQRQPTENGTPTASEKKLENRIDALRMNLISQLTQDLRNPLTAITGMAGMLSRKIYGPLTEKQQEYANVVLNSSQNLLSLTNEIMELGALSDQPRELSLSSVDIEMLAQQGIQPVKANYKKHELDFNLTVEPSSRIWVLDKCVVKQLLHNLILSIAKAATGGSTLRLHISRRDGRLHLTVWISNPWLGENLPQSVLAWAKQNDLLSAAAALEAAYGFENIEDPSLATADALSVEMIATDARQELGLLLCQQLTDIHGGEIIIQGSHHHGYRYVVSLPSFDAD